MFSFITRWRPAAPFVAESNKDRLSYIVNFTLKEKFENFLNQGFVDNVAGPNCYISITDEYIEVCNATWRNEAAVREWLESLRPLLTVLECKLLDESGTVLDSFSNQVQGDTVEPTT